MFRKALVSAKIAEGRSDGRGEVAIRYNEQQSSSWVRRWLASVATTWGSHGDVGEPNTIYLFTPGDAPTIASFATVRCRGTNVVSIRAFSARKQRTAYDLLRKLSGGQVESTSRARPSPPFCRRPWDVTARCTVDMQHTVTKLSPCEVSLF